MSEYVLGADTVQGMWFGGLGDVEEMARFLGGEAQIRINIDEDVIDVGVRLRVGGTEMLISSGTWVVRYPDGNLKLYNQNRFIEEFSPAKTQFYVPRSE